MTDYLLTAPFSQVGVMTGRQNAAATAGACHNFSIHWCAMMLMGVPATPAERMAKLTAGRGEANPVLQRTYVGAFGEAGRDWKSADNLGVAIRGLVRAEYAIDFSAFSQSALLAVIKTPKYDAMVYTFDFTGSVVGAAGGTHSIAFYRKLQGRRGVVSPQGRWVIAFDPNFGEYAIEALEFNYWLNKEKGSYGPFTQQRLFYVRLP
jgi:hypothetical protein